MQASLYLIPVTLGDTEHRRVLPEYNRDVILGIRHFIVENVRTARRFLKKVEPSIVIDDLTFYELNKHTSPEQVAGYLNPLAQGESVGVISEAGCPAVADPGADVVAIAQRKHYPVVPLVGPSSIILSVMASGFNGQSFAFHGYLPIDAAERTSTIQKLEAFDIGGEGCKVVLVNGHVDFGEEDVAYGAKFTEGKVGKQERAGCLR